MDSPERSHPDWTDPRLSRQRPRMKNGGFAPFGKEQEWEKHALLHGCPVAAARMAPERLFIWMLHRDGTLAATMEETGQWRQVAIPLLSIARTLASTGAVSLFMAHSHPSGDPRPSRADIDATRQVWRLARSLGASLHDHLVIGRQRVFSFRASGLL